MTLYTLIKTIKNIASSQPNINFVHDGDVYELNKRMDIDYPAVIISQTSHNNNLGEDYELYGLNIFAIDRLTSDDENRLDVQSWADQLLKTIIAQIEENNLGIIIGEVIIQPFTERFESLCAGCYANLQIQIDTLNCDGDLYLLRILENMKNIKKFSSLEELNDIKPNTILMYTGKENLKLI